MLKAMQNFSQTVISDLKALANLEKAKNLSRFFKTGPGQYGEGDVFWGISVPQLRETVKIHWADASTAEISKLLMNQVHELRLIGLLFLVKHSQKNPDQLESLTNFYLSQTKYINNWDLVDLSAPNILGEYLLRFPNQRPILSKLVKSNSIWEQRIAILATFPLIKRHQSKELFELVDELINHPHDLIHKAVGWMLRELGKRDWPLVESFLKAELTFNHETKPRYKWLPRTALRYSLEKRPKAEYQKYLAGKI